MSQLDEARAVGMVTSETPEMTASAAAAYSLSGPGTDLFNN